MPHGSHRLCSAVACSRSVCNSDAIICFDAQAGYENIVGLKGGFYSWFA
jgi:hypothetical protein